MFKTLFKKKEEDTGLQNENQKLVEDYNRLIADLKLCKQDASTKREIENLERLRSKLL